MIYKITVCEDGETSVLYAHPNWPFTMDARGDMESKYLVVFTKPFATWGYLFPEVYVRELGPDKVYRRALMGQPQNFAGAGSLTLMSVEAITTLSLLNGEEIYSNNKGMKP